MSTPTRTARARLAAATRHHPNDDHTTLQQELKAAKLASHVQAVVQSWPPLTKEQKDAIASVLLRPAGGDAA